MEDLSLKLVSQILPKLGPFFGVIFALAVLQLAVLLRVEHRRTRVWLLSATTVIQMLAAVALLTISIVERL